MDRKNAGKNELISERATLPTATRRRPALRVHGAPYQINDLVCCLSLRESGTCLVLERVTKVEARGGNWMVTSVDVTGKQDQNIADLNGHSDSIDPYPEARKRLGTRFDISPTPIAAWDDLSVVLMAQVGLQSPWDPAGMSLF